MPFLAPAIGPIMGVLGGAGGAAAAGAGAAAPSILDKIGGFLGDNAGALIGAGGSMLQGSGPEMVPFEGQGNAQAIMDFLMPQLQQQLERSKYLANQPQIAYGLPGVNALSQNMQQVPGLDMNLGFDPAVTNMFANPRMVAPGIDESYFNPNLPADQRKQTGDEPWAKQAQLLAGGPAYNAPPPFNAPGMSPPLMPPAQTQQAQVGQPQSGDAGDMARDRSQINRAIVDLIRGGNQGGMV